MPRSRLESCLALCLAALLAVMSAAAEGTAPRSAQDAYFLTAIDGRLPATDSAAAATALSAGHKTEAGNVNWAPGDRVDGGLLSLPERLRRDHGMAVGIVTTVPFNHATPAGFAAHATSRGLYAEIAHEIIHAAAPEVVVGGGHRSALFPSASPDYAALVLGRTPYTHVIIRAARADGASNLAAAAATVDLARGDRLFGLFGAPDGAWDAHLPTDTPGEPRIDRASSADPSLADAVRCVVPVLAQDPDGMFALFEQGDIDWANHDHDYRRMIGSVWDLDRAVAAAVDLIDAGSGLTWADTLVIVTADHANGYMRPRDWNALGIGDLPRQVQGPSGWRYPDGEIDYGAHGHTNELVTIWARGRGAELLASRVEFAGTRIVDNTAIPGMIAGAVEGSGARHVLLFIGDGMSAECEVAASLYLYGEPMALAWHAWGERPDAWAGYLATWDVATYNLYASNQAAAPYDPLAFDPALGYDPLRGGCAPHPLSCAGSWPVLYAAHHVALPLIVRAR